ATGSCPGQVGDAGDFAECHGCLFGREGANDHEPALQGLHEVGAAGLLVGHGTFLNRFCSIREVLMPNVEEVRRVSSTRYGNSTTITLSVRIENPHSLYECKMRMIMPLDEAVRELVHDGDTVALEGFTRLIPVATGHQIIRQGLRDLTLVRMTRHRLRPAHRCRLRTQTGLFLGRQPRGRVAAPLPRRGHPRPAPPAGE